MKTSLLLSIVIAFQSVAYAAETPVAMDVDIEKALQELNNQEAAASKATGGLKSEASEKEKAEAVEGLKELSKMDLPFLYNDIWRLIRLQMVLKGSAVKPQYKQHVVVSVETLYQAAVGKVGYLAMASLLRAGQVERPLRDQDGSVRSYAAYTKANIAEMTKVQKQIFYLRTVYGHVVRKSLGVGIFLYAARNVYENTEVALELDLDQLAALTDKVKARIDEIHAM